MKPSFHPRWEDAYALVEPRIDAQGSLQCPFRGARLHCLHSCGSAPAKAAILAFLPELIRGTESIGDDIRYLMPFLAQDEQFPHVIPAQTGIPRQVFDLLSRASAELPAAIHRGCLSVKIYLKMILVLLVNHYAGFRGSEEVTSGSRAISSVSRRCSS